MKKITMIAALAVIITTGACAQKLDAAKVPAAVKATFAKQYPGVTPKWELEDGKYEASFKKGTDALSAMFEPNGTFTESEIDIQVSALPVSVLSYVKDHYKGKTVKEASKITKADGTVNYEAAINGKDVIFDANGKFLKEMKD